MNVRRLASILVVSLALRADPATLQQSAGITKQEFDRLPSSAVLDVNGGRVTKGEVLTRLERARSGRLARKGSLDLRALNAALARKATLAVSADNAEGQAMKPQSTRIVRRCPTPKIEGIFHVPPVEPGEEFFIRGCGFGKEGIARLEFNEKTADLTAIAWNEEDIHVKVPESLEGVADQEAVVLKVYPPGKVSQPWSPIKFKARRIFDGLEHQDVSVDCFGGSGDYCNQGPNTVGARHQASGLGVGADRVHMPQLKNGWKYVSSIFSFSCGSNGPPGTELCEGAVKEVAPTPSPQVREVVFVFAGKGLATFSYQYSVVMEGPSGIPWK
jgi:hypothetical protein